MQKGRRWESTHRQSSSGQREDSPRFWTTRLPTSSFLRLPGERTATTTFPYPIKLKYVGPLIDGLDDGAYKILFDGKDNAGEPASDGTITAALYDFRKSIHINGIGKVTVLEE